MAVVNVIKTIGTHALQFIYFVLELTYFLAFEDSTQWITSAISEIYI